MSTWEYPKCTKDLGIYVSSLYWVGDTPCFCDPLAWSTVRSQQNVISEWNRAYTTPVSAYIRGSCGLSVRVDSWLFELVVLSFLFVHFCVWVQEGQNTILEPSAFVTCSKCRRRGIGCHCSLYGHTVLYSAWRWPLNVPVDWWHSLCG